MLIFVSFLPHNPLYNPPDRKKRGDDTKRDSQILVSLMFAESHDRERHEHDDHLHELYTDIKSQERNDFAWDGEVETSD